MSSYWSHKPEVDPNKDLSLEVENINKQLNM